MQMDAVQDGAWALARQTWGAGSAGFKSPRPVSPTFQFSHTAVLACFLGCIEQSFSRSFRRSWAAAEQDHQDHGAGYRVVRPGADDRVYRR